MDQRPGVHYDLTYAPVASWTSVQLLMALTTLNGWHTKQIDYVLAFPKVPVEKELFMRIPRGFEVEGVDDPKNYMLKLHQNVYGQKQAGRVWNCYLVKSSQRMSVLYSPKWMNAFFIKGM